MNVSNAGVFVDLQLSLAPAQHVLDCAEVSLFDAEIPFKLLSCELLKMLPRLLRLGAGNPQALSIERQDVSLQP